MSGHKIIALSEALIDFVSLQSGCGLEDSPGFAKAAGSAPANVAAAVAKLGGNAGFVGKVEDDPFGYFLRHTLQEIGVDVSCMLHTSEAKTTLAFVSLQENGERLHHKGISLVTITLGEKGCYYSYAKGDFKATGFCSGFAVIPLDTTGAGDSFIEGLLTRLLETCDIHSTEISLGNFNWSENDLKEAVRFAVATSALTITKKGGILALPHRSEVNNIRV